MSFNSGLVQLWDAIELKFIQNLLGSTATIEALVFSKLIRTGRSKTVPLQTKQ